MTDFWSRLITKHIAKGCGFLVSLPSSAWTPNFTHQSATFRGPLVRIRSGMLQVKSGSLVFLLRLPFSWRPTTLTTPPRASQQHFPTGVLELLDPGIASHPNPVPHYSVLRSPSKQGVIIHSKRRPPHCLRQSLPWNPLKERADRPPRTA